MRREGFCLRRGKLHIPLAAAGKSLKIKVKSTPEFLTLVSSYGVNMALLLIHLEVLALRSWQQQLLP